MFNNAASLCCTILVVMQGTSQGVVSLLFWKLERNVDTGRLNSFMALLPCHNFALMCGGSLAHWHNLGLTLGGVAGHFRTVLQEVVIHKGFTISAVKCWDSLSYFHILQMTVLPHHILTVHIPSPDFLSSCLIKDPLGVTLLFGDIPADWHLLGLHNVLDGAIYTLLCWEAVFFDGVFPDCLRCRCVGTVSVVHQLTGLIWHSYTDRLGLGLTELVAGVGAEFSVLCSPQDWTPITDINTGRVVAISSWVTMDLDQERQQEEDLHVVGLKSGRSVPTLSR